MMVEKPSISEEEGQSVRLTRGHHEQVHGSSLLGRVKARPYLENCAKNPRKLCSRGLCKKFWCLSSRYLDFRDDQSHFVCKLCFEISSGIFL